MSIVATTKMSSKGQIVIPEEIRSRLGLKSGSRFVVLGEDDVVILKTISPPSMKEFNGIIKEARHRAQEVNLKKEDILEAINDVRGRQY